MDPVLHHSILLHRQLRDRLITEFPEVDDETLHDTLEGRGELPRLLGALLLSSLDDAALAGSLRGRIVEMQARAARLEGRAEKKRSIAASVMHEANLRKITEPEFTASLRATPPALVILHEGEIPGEFWKPQAPELERSALATALRAGRQVPGAALGNGSFTLLLRTR